MASVEEELKRQADSLSDIKSTIRISVKELLESYDNEIMVYRRKMDELIAKKRELKELCSTTHNHDQRGTCCSACGEFVGGR